MKNTFELIPDQDLTIKHAPLLQTSLLQVLELYDQITIKIPTALTVDLTGLQLLMAAKQQAKEWSKELKVEFSPSDEVSGLFQQAGFQFNNENM